MLKRTVAACTALLATGQVLVAAPATAAIEALPPGCALSGTEQYIQSGYGTVVEVAGTATANGSRVQIWGKRANAKNQKWRLMYCAGSDHRAYWNVSAQKCLDVKDYNPPHNGSAIHIWTCHGGTNQGWSYPAGPSCGSQGGSRISSHLGAQNFVLDTPNPTANGAAVQLWTGGSAAPSHSCWSLVA